VSGNPLLYTDHDGQLAMLGLLANPALWAGIAGITATWMHMNPDAVRGLLDALHNESADRDVCPDSDSDDEIDDLLDGLEQETDSRGRPKTGQYSNPNGDAQSDFDSLTGTASDNGQKVLADGSRVGVHTSATTGRETLHINRPRGKQNIKIRY
jgi:hypothetical protein